jgi:penicillin-binding protein 1A
MMYKRQNIKTAVLMATIVLPVLFMVSSCGEASGPLQGSKELLSYKNATASKVLSAEGELIGKFYTENRTNVSYSQIPPYLIDALVATEDARFFEHKGVDTRSLFRVLFKTILAGNKNSGGGSTISQQLAKNMFGRQNTGGLAIVRNKVREIILAHRIEETYTKEEILILYLNTVPFGENVFGIEVAASRYFNKKVGQLKIEEAAILVGMLKASTYYNPALHPENARNRRNVVLHQMLKYNYLQPAETDSLRKLPLSLDYRNAESEGIADYFLVRVKKEATVILKNISSETGKEWNLEVDGLIVNTTLNQPLQTYAVRSFREHLSVMQKRLSEKYQTSDGTKMISEITENMLKGQKLMHRANEMSMQTIFDWEGSRTDSISVRDSIKHALTLLHAGLLAMDPQTGAIRAWVGGIDFNTQQYDQILARRQLGSIFKPVIFAAALEEGIEPCQFLDNDSIVVPEYQNWTPDNYDHAYGGKYSVAGALSLSKNVPTFNLFLKVGFHRIDSLWNAMGFTYPLKNTPALALGTAEASLLETAIAYSSFANGGYKIIPQSIVSITTAEGALLYLNDFNKVKITVLSERSTLLMRAMLRKAVMEGTGSPLRTVYGLTAPFAGKTGTTQNYGDAWFAAFNPNLTIVSRVGASSPLIHFDSGTNGTGSSLALPLVALTLKKAESDLKTMDQLIEAFPPLPPDLAGVLDCPDFWEDNLLDKFIDIFKKDKIVYDTVDSKGESRIRSFIEKIFKR